MPKAKTKKTEDVVFEVGQRVSFDYDGNTTEGNVTSVNLKKEVCDVETDDNETLECDFDELTLVEKKVVKKSSKKEESEEKEEKSSKKSSGGTRSLTSLFKKAKVAPKNSFGLPPGNYECLVNGGEADQNDKGISAYLEYVAVNCEDSEIDGRSHRAFYGLVDADGEPQQGIEYFKRDLLELGITEEELEGLDDDDDLIDAINKLLRKIAKAQPWVSVQVKQKGDYTNLFLQGVMEDQDQKPDMPESFGN